MCFSISKEWTCHVLSYYTDLINLGQEKVWRYHLIILLWMSYFIWGLFFAWCSKIWHILSALQLEKSLNTLLQDLKASGSWRSFSRVYKASFLGSLTDLGGVGFGHPAVPLPDFSNDWPVSSPSVVSVSSAPPRLTLSRVLEGELACFFFITSVGFSFFHFARSLIRPLIYLLFRFKIFLNFI